MPYSQLLETRLSVFQSVSPLHTKSSAHVCTLDRVSTRIISSHSRAAESPTSQDIHTQGGSEDKGHCLSHRMVTYNQSGSWFIQFPAEMTAQQTCSEHAKLTKAQLVVFLTTHHSKSRGECQKEPENYTSPVILIAQTLQSSSLVSASQVCLRMLAAPLLGRPRKNDSVNTVLLALTF